MKINYDKKENTLTCDFEGSLILQPINEYGINIGNKEEYPVKLEIKNCRICCKKGKYKFIYKLRWIWEVLNFKF